MNREQAEKLLAALIFDDLDEPSKAELLAYLQTDDELRDRLADMRMAAKLACDAVNDGPAPVLSDSRLAELRRLSSGKKSAIRVFPVRPLWYVAAVLAIGVVFMGVTMPSLNRVRRYRAMAPKPAVSESGRIGFNGGASWHYDEAVAGAVADRERSASTDGKSRLAVGQVGDSEPSGGMGGGMASTRANRRASPEPTSGTRSIETVVDESVGGMYAYESATDSDGLALLQDRVTRFGLNDQRRASRGRSDQRLGQQIESTIRAKEANENEAVDSYESTVALELRREGVQGDISRQKTFYGWSGSISSTEEAVAAARPSPPVAEQSAGAPGIVNGPAQPLAKAPALGDVPTTGSLLKAVGEPAASYRRLELKEDHKSVEGLETSDLSLRSRFAVVPVNPWVMADRDALSTFGLDVDTASYALCKRYIRGGFLPPVGAVRMEEFINAFDYAYPQQNDATFAVHAEGMPSPFAPAGRDLALLKIAVKARTVGRDQRRAAHIVFVIDASASMGQADRLPQVQAAMRLLVDKLSEADRVSVVTCANEARLHMEAVSAREKDRIRQALDAIQPAGPTNLLAGLRLGYAMARRAFVAGQINQVVLCSDGVANVGATEAKDVLDEVDGDRRQGITLTCVGVGYGAYNDAFLESLANRGDGRYVFLDSSEQAREDLVGQLAATLQTVARDARIQVQFDPVRVRRYRLIGYENRDIEDNRFRDDTVDAGEVGSGQCSTALYELELVSSAGRGRGNLGTVFVRYRNSETGQIEEISRSLADSLIRRQTIEENPRFFLAAVVARFAEWLRQSEHAQGTNLKDVQDILDRVSAALSLDQTVRDVAALAHQAENLPRASETTVQP
jgi:Ca-activated chloride channel family protein